MENILYLIGAIITVAFLIHFIQRITSNLDSEKVKQLTFPKDMEKDRRMRMLDAYLSTLSEDTVIRDCYLKVGTHYYLFKDQMPDRDDLAVADHILINYCNRKTQKTG
jgi:hypothetical protein